MTTSVRATYSSLMIKITSNLLTSIMSLKSEVISTLVTNPMFAAAEVGKSAMDSAEELAPSLSNLF